jgi:protoporphyrinogen/coproporphyrinogen III oxidase
MAARVVIIGGGISGLSAAYYLAKGGAGSTIVESRPRLGGVIQTERVEGCTLEAGPDSFLAVKPAALELIADLGLSNEVIGSNDHLRVTFVRKNGKLVPLPDGLMMMVPTKILPLVTTGLLSWGTKIRMGMELLRSPKPHAGDQSVADFVEEHYGREAVDYLAEPLLSGIYGGNPNELSVSSVLPRFVELANKYGSLTRGVLAERAKAAQNHRATSAPTLFKTLKGGLGQMVDAATEAIQGKTEIRRGRAETIERTANGFRIKMGGDWLEADQLVMATEAHNASALLGNVDARMAELLGMVPYTSSMTVALGFDAADFAKPPVGFGFLVPKKERRRLVACTWVGTKFSYRVPEGKVVARCFLTASDDPDDVIASTVTDELREIAGSPAKARFVRIARWPRSMAQYSVGHGERLAELEARKAAIPGLHLAGNAYTGIGIPDCIRMGKLAAQKILAG